MEYAMDDTERDDLVRSLLANEGKRSDELSAAECESAQGRERTQNVAATDLADQAVSINHRIAPVEGIHEHRRDVRDARIGVDGAYVVIHVLRDLSAPFAVIRRVESHFHTILLGQHADQITLIVDHRGTGYSVFYERMYGLQYLHVRGEGDQIARHVVSNGNALPHSVLRR